MIKKEQDNKPQKKPKGWEKFFKSLDGTVKLEEE